MKIRETNTPVARSVHASLAKSIFGLALCAVVCMSAVYAKRSGVAMPLLAVDVEPSASAATLPEFTPEPIEEVNAPEPVIEVAPPVATEAGEPDLRIRYFDGRPCRPVKTIWMTVTAYSPDHRSCGVWADGYTASMKSVWTNAMKLVAADPKVLPMGSIVSVPGYSNSEIVPVLDVGGAIKGARLDVLYPSHRIARRWGVQKLPVTVWEYVDE